MTITVGELFAGISGFGLGFERNGMKVKWQVEIDKDCRRVLAHHYPDAERFLDVRTVGKHNLQSVDIICGGFPCQDVSVAGRRAGFDGARSGLWFEFRRIVDEIRPRMVVIENVPGLFTSNGGRDFATILQGLEKLRYHVGWRVCDSRYFGVPQRRRRVFIVGCLAGSGLNPGEILFKRESLSGDIETGGEARQETAGTAADSSGDSGELLTFTRQGTGEYSSANVDATLAARDYKSATDLVVGAFMAGQGANAGSIGYEENISPDNGSYSLNYTNPVYYSPDYNQDRIYDVDGISPALTAKTDGTSRKFWNGEVLRRLTPTECLRLQGFPDNWADLPDKPLSDSAIYKMCGNAVTVNVAQWLGKRIIENWGL